MNVGFLGAGNMTSGLGRHFIAKGHKLMLSHSRDAAKLDKAARQLGGGTRTGSAAEAARFGDVVVLATGWNGAAEALTAAGPLDGKVLWSIVTPLAADLSDLAIGRTTSGSEELAKVAGRAAFVAGWPPFAEVLASPTTRFRNVQQSLFYCGDEPAAKRAIAPLLAALDVDPVDAGALRTARYLEPTMFLLIHFAYRLKLGPVAARLLRREQEVA